MKTKITELLNIEYPVIQGGMAWVADYHLAAAVSNAGGLGLIGAGAAPASFVKEQIEKCRALTDKPFGVNLMLMNPAADEIAEVIATSGVKVVTTGAGSPEKYMKMWKEAGVKVIPVVASVALAKIMEKSGADAVVAEGCESGGHIGELTTMALVPQVVDGRGVAAALMLGAQGVQVGTRFLVAEETNIHEAYKERVLKAKDIDAQVTGRSGGHPIRSLKNQMTRKYLQMEADGATFEELESLTVGSLRKAVVEGDVKNGTVMAGQIAGMIKKKQTCKEIIVELVDEAVQIMNERCMTFAK